MAEAKLKAISGLNQNQLLEELNKALAREYQAIISYIQYGAVVGGMIRLELSEFLRDEIKDEVRHASFLSDKIAALGGIPTLQPAPALIRTGNESILKQVIVQETDAVERYTALADLAESYGDIDLMVALQNILEDETRHKEQTERLLVGG